MLCRQPTGQDFRVFYLSTLVSVFWAHLAIADKHAWLAPSVLAGVVRMLSKKGHHLSCSSLRLRCRLSPRLLLLGFGANVFGDKQKKNEDEEEKEQAKEKQKKKTRKNHQKKKKKSKHRPISTSANSISASWPKSNWPKSSILNSTWGKTGHHHEGGPEKDKNQKGQNRTSFKVTEAKPRTSVGSPLRVQV